MADIRVPQEISDWIDMRNWGDHHDEWHTVRRWDIYHYLADLARNGNSQLSWAIDVVNYITNNDWQRAPQQEGETGNGLDFLAMHRAMLILLRDNFPNHLNLFVGWTTPPTDPNNPNDPVANGAAMDPNIINAINRVENQPGTFASEEEFGLYLETNLRPSPQNPLARSTDPSTGLHNYLHGRWTDSNSAINLGDPTVNIYNTRFWSLHGWIDKVWSDFRNFHNLPEDNAYRNLIEHNKQMMNMQHHIHEGMVENLTSFDGRANLRPEGLKHAFVGDFGV